MIETWTCERCQVTHRIDPKRLITARNADKVFRCEKLYCSIHYTDKAQPTRNGKLQHVRLYIEQVPT